MPTGQRDRQVDAVVAQLVERSPRKRQATGSTPVNGSQSHHTRKERGIVCQRHRIMVSTVLSLLWYGTMMNIIRRVRSRWMFFSTLTLFFPRMIPTAFFCCYTCPWVRVDDGAWPVANRERITAGDRPIDRGYWAPIGRDWLTVCVRSTVMLPSYWGRL